MGGAATRPLTGRNTAFWLGHYPSTLDAAVVLFGAGWYLKQNLGDAKPSQFLWDEEWVKRSVAARVEWEKAADWDPELMRAGKKTGEFENPVPIWSNSY